MAAIASGAKCARKGKEDSGARWCGLRAADKANGMMRVKRAGGTRSWWGPASGSAGAGAS